MATLKEALPFLLLDLESALVHIGRGDMVAQLREVTIERWTYDELADAAYLHFTKSERNTAESSGETVSVYDEFGINLHENLIPVDTARFESETLMRTSPGFFGL